MSSVPDAASRHGNSWPSGTESRARRRAVLGIACGAVGVIAILDYLTGPVLSMEIFYLIPVAWATALVGRRAGVSLAVASTLAGILSDVVLQAHTRDSAVVVANAAVMFVTLLVVVELIERLRRQVLVARRAEVQSRQFLAFAAHQLRTPIAGIGATADALLLTSDRDPEHEELLSHLRSETARTGRLMNSLLRIARLDTHEELPMRVAPLESLVRAEAERAARLKPSVQWTLELDATTDPAVLCNPEALGEALANLLDNAGRHAHTRVEIAIRSHDDVLEITIHDDGPGLPANRDAAAFQRFVSMDGQGGSGLGLPIARGICEAHDGTLTYDRQSFVIRLPCPPTRSVRHAPV